MLMDDFAKFMPAVKSFSVIEKQIFYIKMMIFFFTDVFQPGYGILSIAVLIYFGFK